MKNLTVLIFTLFTGVLSAQTTANKEIMPTGTKSTSTGTVNTYKEVLKVPTKAEVIGNAVYVGELTMLNGITVDIYKTTSKKPSCFYLGTREKDTKSYLAGTPYRKSCLCPQ